MVDRTGKSLFIEKNNKVVKVGIGNVKAFIPRENLVEGNIINDKSNYYDLRPRSNVNYVEDSEDEF